jgi:hypothetical protein
MDKYIATFNLKGDPEVEMTVPIRGARNNGDARRAANNYVRDYFNHEWNLVSVKKAKESK